jgi:Ribonuclease HI
LIKGYFDGAVRGELNEGSIGAYLEQDGVTIWELSKHMGYNKNSINIEYEALLALLHEIRRRDLCRVIIHGDNQILINQMLHLCRVRDLGLFKLCAEAEKLIRGRSITLTWIPRTENKRADWLSKHPNILHPINSKFSLEQVADYIFLVHAHETYVADTQHNICSCEQFQTRHQCLHLAEAQRQQSGALASSVA